MFLALRPATDGGFNFQGQKRVWFGLVWFLNGTLLEARVPIFNWLRGRNWQQEKWTSKDVRNEWIGE